ncbi:putative membrane protein [Clostridium bornimense]|uniref:Putative membrane protein n=1 Tax=Clostridium bornimense TaxID=1216932 RepID=W6RZ29_9CLOT|nr:hypothetical protein [Clostridium bornimense]CDM67292.1 putative membrane protein [Clostridium bornimense]
MSRKKVKIVLLLASIVLLGLLASSSYGYFNGEAEAKIPTLEVEYNNKK